MVRRLSWQCGTRGFTNAKVGEKLKPLHLAVLYEEGHIQDPQVFHCPAQPSTKSAAGSK